MKYKVFFAAAGCALALSGLWAITGSAANGASRPAPTTAAKPALWRTYDMILNLQNLPRTYTCDQLWYELRGIVLQLGAWPYSINVLPYNCSPTPNGAMKSPDVQVGFQLPFFLQGPAAKSAPAKAIERTIRLAPGQPKTLHSSDCQLMQQISQTLLASLPIRVDEEHFECSAPPRRAANFYVTVSLPVAVKAQTVATTSASGPH
jgi:hypothetical protein